MKADATINEKKIKLGGKKTDQSSTVCQGLKKKARQIISQNHKNIVYKVLEINQEKAVQQFMNCKRSST